MTATSPRQPTVGVETIRRTCSLRAISMSIFNNSVPSRFPIRSNTRNRTCRPEGQLCRVTENVQNARECQDLVKTEEQAGKRNKEHRRTETRDRPDNFGEESD